MPFTRSVYTIVIAAAGVCALVVAWPRTHVDVLSAAVTTGPVTDAVIARGRLEAAAVVDVNAPVSGEIQALDADENAAVRAGDIVARIDPTPFEEALRDARADLAYLESVEDTPPARLADARAAVRKAARDLDLTVVRAPMDGVVVVRNVSVGQLVTAGDGAPVLYRLATDLHQLELPIELRDAELARVRTGGDVVVSVDGSGGRAVHGRVSRVGRTTVVDVPNPDLALRPGTEVTAELGVERHPDAVRIPTDALAFAPPDGAQSIVDGGGLDWHTAGRDNEDGSYEVWRYQRGRLTPIAVRIGLSGEGWTEVIDGGLQPGDEVATDVVVRRASWWSAISIP